MTSSSPSEGLSQCEKLDDGQAPDTARPDGCTCDETDYYDSDEPSDCPTCGTDGAVQS